MENSGIWFSHKEKRYDAELKNEQREFHWSNNSEIWDWDNCAISAVKITDDTIRVIVRSTQNVFSKYKKDNVELRYMLGFDVTNEINKPISEDHNEPPKDNVKDKKYGPPRKRWVIQLDDEYWIWQWAQEQTQIENSNVYKIYLMLKNKKDALLDPKNIFDVKIEKDDRIIPVIYQPAIDSWKNYVREIHCNKINNDEIEVSILFNNESLREHKVLNPIYEWFRSLFYGRVVDIETFKIILNHGIPVDFTFRAIYSGDFGIQKDTTHLENPLAFANVRLHKIKYYFSDMRHPIVFINTSNHAMAEHDTNHRLWKWEYVAWGKNSPILYGEKSRQEIDRAFKPKLTFWK